MSLYSARHAPKVEKFDVDLFGDAARVRRLPRMFNLLLPGTEKVQNRSLFSTTTPNAGKWGIAGRAWSSRVQRDLSRRDRLSFRDVIERYRLDLLVY